MKPYNSTHVRALEQPIQVDLSLRAHLRLSILWFGLNFQFAALLPIVIPTQILLFVTPGAVGNAQQAEFIGWFAALGTIVALVAPPLIGALSDRTPGPLGRRRPYIAIGALLMLLGAVQLAAAREIIAFTAGFIILQLGNNISTAAYQGLIPDLVPAAERGAASGYLGLMTIVGNVAGLGLAGVLLGTVTLGATAAANIRGGASIYYLLTGCVLLVTVLLTLARVHEAPFTGVPLAMPARQAHAWRARFSAAWIAPWRNHNFLWVFLTRCFVMIGLTLFLTYIEYYFAQVVHITNFVQATAVLAVLALFGAVGSALFVGILSDYIRRVPLVCIATMCMALASLAFVVFPGRVPLWPLGIVFGVGYGAYSSVDWALAVDALPARAAAGKDMGLWSIASTLPSIFAPLLGTVVIAVTTGTATLALGYRLVFVCAAGFLLLGALSVVVVREAPPQKHLARRRARHGPPLGWRLASRARAGRARGFLRFWPVWEAFTRWLWHVQSIPNARGGLLEVRFMRYHGQPITLPDGTAIASGDRVCELHIHNSVLAERASVTPWQLLRLLALDLHALATWAESPPFPADVRAIYGMTLLSRAAPRLGFTLRARPRTLQSRLDRFFLTGLLVLYHPAGLNRLLQGTTYGTDPQELWMSRGELRRRYAPPPPR